MRIEHNPPPVPRDQRRKIWFHNKDKDTIHIIYLKFQSDIHPRLWDTTGDHPTLHYQSQYALPICGTGEIFIKWDTIDGSRADHFTVQFDKAGDPYPYICGDRWTMALRRAALKATAENGDE